MRLGLASPIVTHNPGLNNDWEREATIGDLVAVARRADELGFHHLTCSEHVAYPSERVVAPGMGRYWDPLATLSYLAACTEQIRLATHIIVLPYHHPLEVVKRYGTLDLMSGGRVILGVGIGHLALEFELLDVPFADRAARTDDAIRAIRAAFGVREPVYQGTHFAFDGVVVDPVAIQSPAPIWVGGNSLASLRRAAALADGWAPYGLPFDPLAELLRRGRDEGLLDARPLDLILYAEPRIDPEGEPDASLATLGRARELGATIVNLRLVHHSLAHCLEQLEAARDLAATLD
ncbi:MAG: class F420-dependent oxidoreductase [Actinomycetia bacterium]|nr:class F420-dependent oxidoreductase [Actinomycetes bacterium]